MNTQDNEKRPPMTFEEYQKIRPRPIKLPEPELTNFMAKLVEFNEQIRSIKDFDPNTYFEVYNRLRLADGYRLKHIKVADQWSSYPRLYAVKEGEDIPKDKFKMEIANPFIPSPYMGLSPYERFLKYVTSDSSPIGYLQLAIFKTMAERFNLWWHANYGKLTLMKAGLSEQYQVDTTPRVLAKPDGTIIEVQFFVQHHNGGLFRRRVVFNDVKEDSEDSIVPPEVELMY